MPWTIDLKSLDGVTTHVTAAPFQAARITWALDGSGAAEVNLRASDVSGGQWLAGRRRIVVKDGVGTARFAGWLDRLERSGSPSDGSNGQKYRASARGLAAILDQRVVHGDFSKVSVSATTIAWDLIAHAQGQTDGNHGFTLGTITGTAPARTRYFCDGDIIGERIRELAEMSPGGFAWEISPSGAFNAWVGGRGTDLSATTTLAPADCRDWQCTFDTSELATYVTGLGDRDDNTPCGPPLVVDNNGQAATYGRREVVIESETNDVFELDEKTTEELRARTAARVNLRTAWIEGRGPWSFGTVWLGDIVDAALGAEFGGNLDVRCISVSVTLEDRFEVVEMEWEAA